MPLESGLNFMQAWRRERNEKNLNYLYQIAYDKNQKARDARRVEREKKARFSGCVGLSGF